MQISFFIVVAFAVALIALVLSVAFLWRHISQQVDMANATLAEKNELIHRLYKEVEQFQQTALTLSEQIKQTQLQMQQLKQATTNQVNELMQAVSEKPEQDDNQRFYSRALKLVQKGADIDELMAECELPRAEAEMLLAIHRRAKS